MQSLTVNDEDIHQKIKFLIADGLQSWRDNEAYARCLFYFGKSDKAASYFLKAANKMEKRAASKKEKNPEEFNRLKLIQANYYRLAREQEKSLQLYNEIQDQLKSIFKNKYESNKQQGISILRNLSYCYFFLENYEQSIQYGNLVTEWIPISVRYSQAILHQDRQQMQSALDTVIKEIKNEETLPYDTGAEVSLWDWYEIGKDLLKKE